MERKQETMSNDRLAYSIVEAAKMIGISRWTMGDLVRKHKIPHVRIGNITKRSRVLILKKDLESYLASRTVKSVEDEIRLMNGWTSTVDIFHPPTRKK